MHRLINVFLLALCLPAQPALSAENVLLVTLDGLRWQELFSGADSELIKDSRFNESPESIASKFWRETPEERREVLMPFFWGTIAKQGVLYGNRSLGSEVNLRNTEWFSYPGYNEILTGAADANITSNDKIPNKNVTVLEWVNQQPDFQGSVAAFASWDVFPYIINEPRKIGRAHV